MKADKLVWCESLRADSYNFLSGCYYAPDDKLVRKITNSEEAKGELFAGVAQYAPQSGELEILRIDFSKLFVGPFKLLAPPYGSLYLERGGKIMGDSTEDVKLRYREAGLSLELKEAPDHIAVELEFMYYLSFQEMAAIENSDQKQAAGFLKKQKYFLNTHLGRWISEFAGNVKTGAETLFYKNLADITESFIKRDLEYLSNR